MKQVRKFQHATMMIACCVFITAGSAVAQDRYYDYEPNRYERQIIDYVRAVRAAAGDSVKFIPRIALAIQFAADTLGEPFDSAMGAALAPAGGFHRLFDLGSNDEPVVDSALLAEIADFLPDSGTYSFKIIDGRKPHRLVLYCTDVFMDNKGVGWIGASPPRFEGLPDQHAFGSTGSINADSIKCILYRGEYMLSIAPDSIIATQTFLVTDDRYETDFGFEKKRQDIFTVNIYAFSRDRQRYDLTAMFCPSIVGDAKMKKYSPGEK